MNKVDDILEKLKNTEQPQIDLTEEIMNSLSPRPLQGERKPKRRVSPLFWRGIGGGLIAASIVLLIAFNYNNKVVPEEAPVVAEVVEQPAPEPTEVPEPTKLTEPTKAAESAEPTMPTKPKSKRIRKARPQETAAPTEPVLAESMPMPEQGEDPIEKAARIRRELRQRGEQVEQYVAMLNERVRQEQYYMEY